MTTIQEQMQTGPVRASEILAKLLDTSATAVKTRGRLLTELKGELDRQAEFEEQHLFPVLEKHEETKDLMAEAGDDNQRMRKLLGELERNPKDSEAFGDKVAELRDMLQQHLRDDRKELLPAIVKVLDDEEAGIVVRKTGGETIEITPSRHADGGERRPEDERAEAERQTSDIVKAGADLARQGAEVARMAMETADTTGERDGPDLSMTVPEETQEAQEAAPGADMAAVGRSMVTLFNEQAHHALQVQTIMAAGRARTMAEVAHVQSAFIAGSFQRMGQFNDRYLAFIRSWRSLLLSPSSHR